MLEGGISVRGKVWDNSPNVRVRPLEEGIGVRVYNGMKPIHPGKILGEELQELGLSANALANALGVPTNRITSILNGQRGITADTALRLSRYFGTSPQLWLSLQQAFELRKVEVNSGDDIADRVEPRAIAQVAGTEPNDG